jgi:hypothetical protein
MKTPSNGSWKTIAVLVLAAFQGLCFYTLQEIKIDIRETMRRQVLADVQLAVIAVRHAGEDVADKLKPKTP